MQRASNAGVLKRNSPSVQTARKPGQTAAFPGAGATGLHCPRSGDNLTGLEDDAMKRLVSTGCLLLALGAWAAEKKAASQLTGDYVEVRTASVFAGACHFNGEVVTTGQDALMAWKIERGAWNGTRLDGVRAVAVVSSAANLAEAAPHRSELILDVTASEAQARALVDALSASYGVSLGKIVSVRRAPVSFDHLGKEYRVKAEGIAQISVEAMPNDECCKMPSLVWYEPLIPLAHRKVGYTRDVRYEGGAVSDSWRRADENSAFYGSFAI
jgi:hypothetical protein